MTFNCDMSGNHGCLTDSDTLWRAGDIAQEKRSYPLGEKNRGEKKKEEKNRDGETIRRGESSSR